MKAVMLMIASMLAFTLVDSMVKLLSSHMGVGQILCIFGVGTAVCFAVLAKSQRQTIWSSAYLHPSLAVRCFGEILGGSCLVIALANTSLSAVTALVQFVPLLLTAMAMMVLGERRTVARIMAVLTGFAGTIIIIRPTIDGFDLYLLTGFFAAVGLALRDLSVRLVPPDMPIAGLSFYGAVAVACTGFIMMMIEGGGTMPDGWPLVYAIIMVMLAAAGLWGIALSLRLADISAISPFRYSRIIFGIVIGITVFSEQIDSFMIAGSVLILGAGLYSWYSETRADAP